jgi:peptidylprolyl isomerase
MSKIVFPIIIFLLAGFFIYRTYTNHKTGEENVAKGQAFLNNNATKDGIVVTHSGLQYEVIHKSGADEKPSSSDTVEVHYQGSLIDGTVFDSSIKRGQPISFKLNQVIKGWQEGLTHMSVGDKFRLYIPSTLGYGKNGTGPIPPSATLIFDVELLNIK